MPSYNLLVEKFHFLTIQNCWNSFYILYSEHRLLKFHNERLEFLGTLYSQVMISEYLFASIQAKGWIVKMRSMIVVREA